MTEKREARRLAKEIRKETGVPLGPANVIARHLQDYTQWELPSNPVTSKYCTMKSVGNCSCCMSTELEVTGPKGKWTRY